LPGLPELPESLEAADSVQWKPRRRTRPKGLYATPYSRCKRAGGAVDSCIYPWRAASWQWEGSLTVRIPYGLLQVVSGGLLPASKCRECGPSLLRTIALGHVRDDLRRALDMSQGPACDARLNAGALAVVRDTPAELVDELGSLGAWADDAHVSGERSATPACAGNICQISCPRETDGGPGAGHYGVCEPRRTQNGLRHSVQRYRHTINGDPASGATASTEQRATRRLDAQVPGCRETRCTGV
jgi:hypothetical protein